MLEAIGPKTLPAGTRAERLQQACAEFESLFIAYMLKSMRETVFEDGLLGNSNESQILQSMFDENLAQGIARGGGIGIGQVLYERLKTGSGSGQ